jgi:uncharacterized membrane protein YdjX (TVP38/TMEM64 family)
LGRYPFGRYLLSLALAELPFGVGTVYLGRGIVERSVTLVAAMFLALAVLSVWAFRALHRRLAAIREVFDQERRAAARDAATPGR